MVPEPHMPESNLSLTQQACLETIENQFEHLQLSIARLVKMQQELPEGEHRDRLLNEISCLDVIVEVMRVAVVTSNPFRHYLVIP
jgi:hypothetical protein